MSSVSARAVGRRKSKLYLVLTPDLTIVEASDSYLRATLVWRDDVRGCQLFDGFPDNPNDANASGVRNLRASLARVLESATADRMAVQRYDVRDRMSDNGGWVEKFWTPVNTPLFGSGSREITHIRHEVEDVSEVLSLRVRLDEEKLILAEERATIRRMRQDVQHRERLLREIDARLATLLTGDESPEAIVETVRRYLRIPAKEKYWSPGERAPETAVYSALHRRACEIGPRFVFIATGGTFPSCPRCGNAVLYRLGSDLFRGGR